MPIERDAGAPPADHQLVEQGDGAAGGPALEFRLNRLVLSAVAMLEQRMADEKFAQGSARMLTELCRAAKTMRSANKTAAKAREATTDEPGRSDDPAQILRDLAARFERLRRETSRGEAGDPRPGE
jgi:hypothetical protein